MFKIHSEYKPTGDQPKAIEYLVKRNRVWKEVSDFTWRNWFSEKLLQWLTLLKKFKSQL